MLGRVEHFSIDGSTDRLIFIIHVPETFERLVSSILLFDIDHVDNNKQGKIQGKDLLDHPPDPIRPWSS